MEDSPKEPARGFKGVWIPAALWLDDSISWLEKALIAEIDSLATDEPCWASSEHLAKMMNSTSGSIRIMLSELTRKGYLWQLGSNGRHTWRCVNPQYSSDPAQLRKWAENPRMHPAVTSAVTARLHRDTRGDTSS